ncbi:MAG: DUF4157 domain-containing protein, partial [Myxococcales bacterium]|nr:DUF4157 domain-containing protein [Myxococcales bacterium]
MADKEQDQRAAPQPAGVAEPQREEAPASRAAAEAQSSELLGGGLSEAAAAGGDDPASAQAAELSALGGGAPLPAAVRGPLEAGLGASLAGVRVHSGPPQGLAAASMGARALARGQDIIGSAGALDPSTPGGRRTLAHEVVHTVQNQRGGATGVATDALSEAGGAVEVEAEAGAEALLAGRSFTVRESGGGVARDKAAVTAKLDESPFNAAETLALMQQQSRADVRDILGDTTVTDKMVAKFDGAQMARAMVLLWSDPPAWGDASCQNRSNLLRRAGAGVETAHRYLGMASAAGRVKVAEDATLRPWLAPAGGAGALGILPSEARGLSAEVVASPTAMQWVVSSSSADALLRAAAHSAAGAAAVIAAIDAAGGWGWLANLPNGAGLTPDQMSSVQTLSAGAAAGSPARTALQAKIAAAPLAATPAEALTQLRAYLGGTDGTEMEILQLIGTLDAPGQTVVRTTLLDRVRARLTGENLAQGLMRLGSTPAQVAAGLDAAGVATPGPIMAALAGASVADRVAAASDATAAAYISRVSGPLHPRQVYAVQPGEERQFFATEGYAGRLIALLPPADALLELTGDDAVGAFGAYADAHPATITAWIDRLPPNGQRHDYEIRRLRALALACNNAAIDTKVGQFLGDGVTTGDVSTPVAPPASAAQGPLARLDELLDGSGSPADILSACGALVHPENQTVVRDEARVDKLQDKLSDAQYYQACVALRLTPKWQIKFLLSDDSDNAPRVQSIINASTQQQKLEIIGWESLIDDIKGLFQGAQALNVFGFATSLPADALRRAEFRQWLFEGSASSDLLRIFATDDATAARIAPALDANDGWGWLGSVRGGMALLPDERAQLSRLRAVTTNADTQQRIDALTGDTTDVMAAGDAFTELKSELDALINTDEDQVLRLANQLEDGQKATLRTDTWMQKAVSCFNAEEMSRYVLSLGFSLPEQIRWVTAAAGGEPPPAQVQMLINRADLGQQIALLADATAVTTVRTVTRACPLQTLSHLAEAPAVAMAYPTFWPWFVATVTSFDLLRTIAGSGVVALAIAVMDANGHLTAFDDLPRGTGLTPAARGQVDTIFHECVHANCEKKLFSIRFDVSLSGDWTETERGDLTRLYDRLAALPINQVANNPRLVEFHRHHSGGGTYDPGANQVNIGADLTYEWEQYSETSTEADPADRWNERVKKFDTTTRHEVGHAVDSMLGDRTSIVYDWAGWHKYAEGDL